MTKQLQSEDLRPGFKTIPRWLPISLILFVAAVLFTYRLGSESVWVDELFSLRDANDGGLFEIYKANSSRPLYYILLSLWMQVSSSDVWLRLLSVVFAVISVFLIYQLGRRIAGEAEGLVAALLLAASPLFINHAQEIRMYALSLCLGLAGSLSLANALLIQPSQKPSQRVLAGWALFRLLAILTVPLNLTLLLPDTLLVFLRFRRQSTVLVDFTKWAVLLFILWSPSVLLLLGDLSPSSNYAAERAAYSQPPGLNNLIYPLKFWMVWPYVVSVGATVNSFYKLFTLMIAGLLGAGLIHWRRSPALLWAGAWFIIPLIPIVVFARVSAPIWEPRYVLFVSPYLFIMLAAGFTRLWRDWKAAATVAIAIYFVAISGALAHYYIAQNRPDYKFNIETIEQYEQAGDLIIWNNHLEAASDLALNHYYKGSSEISLKLLQDVNTPKEIQKLVSEFPTGYKRYWLVIDDFPPISKDFESIITETYSIEEIFDYKRRSKVVLLTPHNTSSAQPTS